jgi:hypothetical protein
MAEVVLVEQAVMSGENVPLNAPAAKELHVAPKLPPAEGLHESRLPRFTSFL